MLKVLHVIPELSKGGAERISLDICNELQKRENVLTKIIVFRDVNQYEFLSKELDVEIIPSSVSISIKSPPQTDVSLLQRKVDSFGPDVLHLHLFESVFVCSFLSLKRVKVVIHFHDNMIQFKKLNFANFFSKSSLINYFERNTVMMNLKGKDVTCIGISKDTFQYIQNNLPYPTVKLHNAIDVNRFKRDGFEEKASQRIVMIGSLVPKKGHKMAIEVIQELKKRGLIFYLDILGKGELEEELKELSVRLDVADLVTFHGIVDDPENYLGEAFCYLHTAIYEPFGLALIEAMATGLPVVCTDAMGNRDLIKEGENGFMLKKRDPTLLADKIEYLLENNNERKKMAETAILFSENFDIRNYCSRLISIYNNSSANLE